MNIDVSMFPLKASENSTSALCSIYNNIPHLKPQDPYKCGKQNPKKVCAKNEKSPTTDWHEILAGEIGFNLRGALRELVKFCVAVSAGFSGIAHSLPGRPIYLIES